MDTRLVLGFMLLLFCTRKPRAAHQGEHGATGAFAFSYINPMFCAC